MVSNCLIESNTLKEDLLNCFDSLEKEKRALGCGAQESLHGERTLVLGLMGYIRFEEDWKMSIGQ